jgi:maltooligosyltrehalose trehalohydrolase
VTPAQPAAPAPARLRVWAPDARQVVAEVDGRPHQLAAAEGGWWSVTVPGALAGARYGFRLDDGDLLADPRSPRQPDGPDAPSELYDHDAFRWTDAGWRGAPLPGGVVYELHTGTFTPEGTFDAARSRLDHLVNLGVTHVEVMPVAAFPGRRGWGYDGIGLWAVHEPYGGPDGFKRFVDACHASNLAVILDVVYNHVGIGNRLADLGPYFTDAHVTPWGPAVNLDQPGSDEVRAFITGNALMWLRDYHLDGLRLDAVHALADSRAVHLLEEMSVAAGSLAAQLNREILLIAESDANDPRLVTSRDAGGYGLSAQWSDDFHHAVHAAVTGERHGYYCDFGSMAVLAKAISRVFVHDGTWSQFRGRTHGRPVELTRQPGHRFLGFLQNHDQVGNRAAGDRITASLTPALAKVAAGLVLTAPFTPLLFMGEEWGASSPFQYFTDHQDQQLGQAVSRGRRAEFSRHGWTEADVPDPQDEKTFVRSQLNWSELGSSPHAGLLDWYRELIALRRDWPELTAPGLLATEVRFDEQQRWLLISRGRLRIAANLSGVPRRITSGATIGAVLAASSDDVVTAGDSVRMPAESLAVLRAADRSGLPGRRSGT